MPEGYPIKGNEGSMLYHEPGSRYYKATKAEVWFDSVESAEAAGFTAPGAAKTEDAAVSDVDSADAAEGTEGSASDEVAPEADQSGDNEAGSEADQTDDNETGSEAEEK